jgi:hypothetical protein
MTDVAEVGVGVGAGVEAGPDAGVTGGATVNANAVGDVGWVGLEQPARATTRLNVGNW